MPCLHRAELSEYKTPEASLASSPYYFPSALPVACVGQLLGALLFLAVFRGCCCCLRRDKQTSNLSSVVRVFILKCALSSEILSRPSSEDSQWL